MLSHEAAIAVELHSGEEIPQPMDALAHTSVLSICSLLYRLVLAALDDTPMSLLYCERAGSTTVPIVGQGTTRCYTGLQEMLNMLRYTGRESSSNTGPGAVCKSNAAAVRAVRRANAVRAAAHVRLLPRRCPGAGL